MLLHKIFAFICTAGAAYYFATGRPLMGVVGAAIALLNLSAAYMHKPSSF